MQIIQSNRLNRHVTGHCIYRAGSLPYFYMGILFKMQFAGKQGDYKNTAIIQFTLYLDFSMMQFDNLFAEGKSETGTELFLGRKKTV